MYTKLVERSQSTDNTIRNKMYLGITGINYDSKLMMITSE